MYKISSHLQIVQQILNKYQLIINLKNNIVYKFLFRSVWNTFNSFKLQFFFLSLALFSRFCCCYCFCCFYYCRPPSGDMKKEIQNASQSKKKNINKCLTPKSNSMKSTPVISIFIFVCFLFFLILAAVLHLCLGRI